MKFKTKIFIGIGILVILGVILGTLGGLGYFNKKVIPPGTDPKDIPGSVTINNIVKDSSSMTIYFTADQTCKNCVVQLNGIIDFKDKYSNISFKDQVYNTEKSHTVYLEADTITKLNLEAYQRNLSLNLEGPHTKITKTF